jgi:hypothetical protein
MKVLFSSDRMSGCGAECVISMLERVGQSGVSVGALVIRGASVYKLD